MPQPADPEALFQIATRQQAVEIETLPEDHLARAIALAQMGVLDDAERELRLAFDGGTPRADHLLRQVRSWRQSARPTRTNGAQ